MEEIKYKNNIYVNCDYILKNAIVYSKGCRTSRSLIKKKGIEKKYYKFFRKTDTKYKKSDGKSVKFDKVFILKSYFEKIPELATVEMDIEDEDGIKLAPDIIELDDKEKFCDDKGNTLDIETRGERNVNNIYFKVKDVAKYFGMKSLNHTIVVKDNYKYNKHYIYFICKKSSTGTNLKYKSKQSKELFLTYTGILRVLFISKNNKMDAFITWATNTLFTMQMGTIEHKKELFKKELGYDIDETRKMIKNNTNMSVIYLLSLGYVKDLKDKMVIPEGYNDNDIVYKYGFTNDYNRRLKEHKGNFKEFDVKSLMFNYVDSKLLSKAENRVKAFITFKNNNQVEYKDFKELIVMNSNELKCLKTLFDDLNLTFGGDQASFINEIEKQKLIMEKDYGNKIHKLEMENVKLSKDNELLKKDNEILNLKLQIDKMNNKN